MKRDSTEAGRVDQVFEKSSDDPSASRAQLLRRFWRAVSSEGLSSRAKQVWSKLTLTPKSMALWNASAITDLTVLAGNPKPVVALESNAVNCRTTAGDSAAKRLPAKSLARCITARRRSSNVHSVTVFQSGGAT